MQSKQLLFYSTMLLTKLSIKVSNFSSAMQCFIRVITYSTHKCSSNIRGNWFLVDIHHLYICSCWTFVLLHAQDLICPIIACFLFCAPMQVPWQPCSILPWFCTNDNWDIWSYHTWKRRWALEKVYSSEFSCWRRVQDVQRSSSACRTKIVDGFLFFILVICAHSGLN